MINGEESANFCCPISCKYPTNRFCPTLICAPRAQITTPLSLSSCFLGVLIWNFPGWHPRPLDSLVRSSPAQPANIMLPHPSKPHQRFENLENSLFFFFLFFFRSCDLLGLTNHATSQPFMCVQVSTTIRHFYVFVHLIQCNEKYLVSPTYFQHALEPTRSSKHR